MVWANKAALIPILVGIVVSEWVILSFWYSGRLASKEAEIRLQDRQLADYGQAGCILTSRSQGKDRGQSGIAVQVRDLNNIPREAELLRTALKAAHVDIELMNMGDFPPKYPVQLVITATASS